MLECKALPWTKTQLMNGKPLYLCYICTCVSSHMNMNTSIRINRQTDFPKSLPHRFTGLLDETGSVHWDATKKFT